MADELLKAPVAPGSYSLPFSITPTGGKLPPVGVMLGVTQHVSGDQCPPRTGREVAHRARHPATCRRYAPVVATTMAGSPPTVGMRWSKGLVKS